jgi:hypothetical protein
MNTLLAASSQLWWIPEKFDAIYGAAIGGAIAIVTAMLSSRQARKRLEQELRHASEEKANERRHGLRRETYIPFVDAYSRAIGFVMQMGTVPFEEIRKSEATMQLGVVIARLSLVAPRSVQEPMYKAHRLLTQLTFVLFAERGAIERVAGEVNAIDFDVQLRLNRQKELQLRQEKHIDEKTAEPGLMSFLFEQHKQATAEIDALLAKRAPLVRKKTELEIQLLKNATAALPDIGKMNVETMLAVRNDLGMAVDADWYRTFAAEAADGYMADVKKFQADLEKMVLG